MGVAHRYVCNIYFMATTNDENRTTYKYTLHTLTQQVPLLDECLKGVQSGPATDFVATKTPGMCKPCHGSVSLTISFALHWKDSHREYAELAQDVSKVVVDPLTYQL